MQLYLRSSHTNWLCYLQQNYISQILRQRKVFCLWTWYTTQDLELIIVRSHKLHPTSDWSWSLLLFPITGVIFQQLHTSFFTTTCFQFNVMPYQRILCCQVIFAMTGIILREHDVCYELSKIIITLLNNTLT